MFVKVTIVPFRMRLKPNVVLNKVNCVGDKNEISENEKIWCYL